MCLQQSTQYKISTWCLQRIEQLSEELRPWMREIACVLFPTTAADDLIKCIASPYKTFVMFISLEQHSYSKSIHNLQGNLCVCLTAIHLWIELLLETVTITGT